MGELAALATAVLWTLSAVAWTLAGRYTSATAIAFIRLVISCWFLSAHGLIFRQGLVLPTDASSETWFWLGLSGFIGFFLADLCLFKALLMIGPRLTLLIQALTPPMTAILSRFVVDERLSMIDWLGMLLTLGGITWVVMERTDKAGDVPRKSHVRTGVILAVLAAYGQAAGFVLSKIGLGNYDPVAGTYIRVLAGIVGFVLMITVTRRWHEMFAVVFIKPAMVIITLGSFVGPVLGVVFSLIAVRDCHTGVAATIIMTTPVLILPFVIFVFREKVSPRAAGGALLSVVGVAVLMLWPDTGAVSSPPDGGDTADHTDRTVYKAPPS